MRRWKTGLNQNQYQVFLGFANFYWRFIQGFSKIARPLTSILQTTRLSKNLTVLIDVAERNEIGIVGDGGNCEDKTIKTSLSKNLNRAIGYLTPKARLAFIKLSKVFTKALILWHFDPKCHLRIETDVSGYAIGGVLSQLTSNNLASGSLLFLKNDFSQNLIQNSRW